MPVLEVDNSRSITPGVYGHDAKTLVVGQEGVPDFICPAKISASFARTLQNLAIRGHQAIGAVDVSRIDFRCNSAGKPFLMEINSLPGLSPGFSDLCVIANAEGISYRNLILEILYLGASRYGLVEKASEVQAELEVFIPYSHSRIPAAKDLDPAASYITSQIAAPIEISKNLTDEVRFFLSFIILSFRVKKFSEFRNEKSNLSIGFLLTSFVEMTKFFDFPSEGILAKCILMSFERKKRGDEGILAKCILMSFRKMRGDEGI